LAQFSDYAKRVVIASTEVNTGEYYEFDNSNTNFRDLAQAAVCSSSIPGIFPPHIWKNRGVFMDGGTVYNINLEGAVAQCLDLGYTESQIEIDALFCGAPDLPRTISKSGATWENWQRGRELRHYYNNSNSIAASLQAHP